MKSLGPLDEQIDEGYKALCEVANANQAIIEANDSNIESVRKLIDSHQIVLGIWQDADNYGGVAFRIIKGILIVKQLAESDSEQAQMIQIFANKQRRDIWTAIHCTDGAHALALEQVFFKIT